MCVCGTVGVDLILVRMCVGFVACEIRWVSLHVKFVESSFSINVCDKFELGVYCENLRSIAGLVQKVDLTSCWRL